MGAQGRNDRQEPPTGGGASRTYVNHMHLDVSLSEVLIDVGQAGPGEAPAITGRFVTSPDYLLTIRSTISGAIDRYQAEFGGIVSAGPGAGRG
jgi:hypothetical protein